MYKGFDENLRCRGFQYETGETYEEKAAELCKKGFHACEKPLDVFRYYPPGAESRYCEVELTDPSSEESDDSKRVAKKIKIGAEIGIPGLVKAHIDYVKSNTTTEYTDPGAATARGRAAVGAEGIACARGNNVKVKGGLGSILVLVEEKTDSWKIDDWKVVEVDGEAIKPDTWYKLKNGEIVEVRGEK